MSRLNETSMRKLKSFCYRKGYEIYGKDFFGSISRRLDYELDRIETIPAGADSFLKVSEYLIKVRNLYRSVRNKDLWYTFRGPVSSGLVSYLLGITNCNPVELSFYSWSFFMKKSKMDFSINMSMDACRILSDQEMYLPQGLTLYADRDLTDLEVHRKKRILTHPVENRKNYDGVIRDYFRFFKACDDVTLLTGFQSFDENYVSNVREILEFLRSMDMLPKNLSQLMKLNGFLHSRLRETNHLKMIQNLSKNDKEFYDGLISCPEDIYEELVKNECDISVAERIAKRVQRNGDHLTTEDLLAAVEFAGEEIFEQMPHIDHLFYRSQIFEKSCLTAKLMEVGLNPTEYRNAEGVNYGFL